MKNSWMTLPYESAHTSLPAHLRQLDSIQGRDVGWLEQMTPFIKSYSRENQRVIDPFAGLGTTLIAAGLLNRIAVGIEIDKNRCQLIDKRWQYHSLEKSGLELHLGDSTSVLKRWQTPPCHLCLTNIPYFGTSLSNSFSTQKNHFYQAHHYTLYLDSITHTFKQLRPRLVAGAKVICMVQNTHQADGSLLPLAWDIGRCLNDVFKLFDERILIYPNQDRNSAPHQHASNLHSNRQHEYALIACKYLTMDEQRYALKLLSEWQNQGIRFIVFGSYASWLRKEHILCSDVDLLIKPCFETVKQIALAVWKRQGSIYTWDDMISNQTDLEKNWERIKARLYLRLLIETDQLQLQIDCMFRHEDDLQRLEVNELPLPHVNNDIETP